MKKINLTIALLSIILLVACGDKGYDVSEIPTFTIKNTDSHYPAAGGSGTIEINPLQAGTPVVTSEKDWCRVTLSGSTVNITVDPHSELSSRESAVKIRVGDYSRTIGIYQNGIIFYPLTDDVGLLGDQIGSELIIPLFRDGNFDLTVITHPDWVDARIVDDKLIITATEEAPTEPREGEILLSMEEIVKSVKFTQKEFTLGYDVFIGSWIMTAYNEVPTEAAPVDPIEYEITITAKEEGKTLNMSGLLYDVELTYEDGSVYFNASQVVGDYTTGGVTYPVHVRSVNDATTSNATATIKIYSTYELVDGNLILSLFSDRDGYTGFAFYYVNASGSGTLIGGTKYRHEIKMYKQ